MYMGELWGFKHFLHQDIFITNDIMINEKFMFFTEVTCLCLFQCVIGHKLEVRA